MCFMGYDNKLNSFLTYDGDYQELQSHLMTLHQDQEGVESAGTI